MWAGDSLIKRWFFPNGWKLVHVNAAGVINFVGKATIEIIYYTRIDRGISSEFKSSRYDSNASGPTWRKYDWYVLDVRLAVIFTTGCSTPQLTAPPNFSATLFLCNSVWCLYVLIATLFTAIRIVTDSHRRSIAATALHCSIGGDCESFPFGLSEWVYNFICYVANHIYT